MGGPGGGRNGTPEKHSNEIYGPPGGVIFRVLFDGPRDTRNRTPSGPPGAARGPDLKKNVSESGPKKGHATHPGEF